MLDQLKKHWKWLITACLAALALFSSTKRDSKKIVKSSDDELEKNKFKNISEKQTELYEEHLNKRKKEDRLLSNNLSDIEKKKESRQKELENNPEKLDSILKEKYNLKEG